jgi:Uma2 family endonuclease
MVRQVTQEDTADDLVIYPDSDGEPMAQNTLQFNWIVKVKEGLEILFAAIEDIFVAGDLFWYPVQGDNTIKYAPDAMVVFGRPKGYRGSYLQWKEGNIPPQVVFEILSPSNTRREMQLKLDFYQKYGVEEYYVYDPEKNRLTGWLRSGKSLKAIKNINGWVSPRLAIKFVLTPVTLEIYRPDNRKFATPIELEEQIQDKEQQRIIAEQRAQQAERLAQQTERRAQQAEHRAQQTERLAQQAERLAQQAEHRAQQTERLAQQAEHRAETERIAKEAAQQELEKERQRYQELLARLQEGSNQE